MALNAVATPGVRAVPTTGTAESCQPFAPSRSRSVDVVVLDAQHRQSLACIRRYARDGLRVGVVASPEFPAAQGLASRHYIRRNELPSPVCEPSAYVDALLQLIRDSGADLVIPADDATIDVLRQRRADLEAEAALPLASEAAMTVAVSKQRTVATAAELGIRTPRTIVTTDLAEVLAAVRDIGTPVVLKPDQSWNSMGEKQARLSPVVADSIESARSMADAMLAYTNVALVQEWLPGAREAVSLFYASGRSWARFAQVSHREWPLLGGTSVLCEGIPLRPELAHPAETLVRAINLEGCSLIEFRRDRRGHPVLMEVNPRMAGSVSLAIASGVDFPGLLRDWALQRPLREVRSYRTGRRLRWVSGDIWSLRETVGSRGHPDARHPVAATATFISDFVRRPARLEPFELRDPMPALAEFRSVVIDRITRRLRKGLR